MPELPEVERAARVLERAVRGKTIVALRVLHPSLARRLPLERLAQLRGRTIERVERRGKHQLLHLDNGMVLHAHFRMTGDWMIGHAHDPDERFTRAVLEFSDGTRVSLVDSRALATLTVHFSGEVPLPPLGPEPFSTAFTSEWLRHALERRRGAIKLSLLDQRVVAGLGNIYAAEALWLARISPRAIAARLGPERRDRLVRAIRDVLRRAPAARYTERDAGARWRVYDREGKPCRRCGTPIARIVQGGRSTYFCPTCQRR
ncbi:MAG TPA: bifunctional DNA-formamidopyrimidine glycosylase/DNA-(apurinic or apyrimidinic site) lyase [Gemmatimonadaceae bacterium]|jgi:formamidopyrimidine-DNA glycosylase|nr:bifunctional DNA-formamidopyrimidine glycosylase/DNA-(apurinic or apyrimidinic site) lyase [Gemmatimonadaceae bacterium]